jgi:hypothetical protein
MRRTGLPDRLLASLFNERGLTVGALLLLILVIATGWWWISRGHPPAPQEAGTAPLSLASTAASAARSDAAPAVPRPAQPAVVASIPAPEDLHAEELRAIDGMIQEHRFVDAETRLTQLPADLLQEETARQTASALWNNLGVLKQKDGGPAAGVPAYQKALGLYPGSPTATLNLTQAYWQTQDPALTRDLLERAALLAPGEAWPHLALADLLYDKDDLAGAKQHLDQALHVASPTSEYRPYVNALAAKLARAEQAERSYVSRESSHFVVKFNGNEDHDVWTRVLGILEDAYRDIGQRFSYFPSHPIIVVLHTKESFQSATGSPAWADGLFDPMLGRIQVPTQRALTDQDWLMRVLRHEYVHALLHQRMDGRLGAVPTWLNEGLAMQLAGDPWPDIDRIARGPITIIPLNHLEGGWGGLPQAAAMVAYLEGNSATRYLIDRYGMGKVQDLLSGLARRQPLTAAMYDQLSTSYEEFQRQWVNELNARVQTGRL